MPMMRQFEELDRATIGTIRAWDAGRGTMVSLERSFGCEAFGFDPANYHAARPPYAEVVWQALRRTRSARCRKRRLDIAVGSSPQ